MNPFSKNRWEYIPTHLYYLPTEITASLEEAKPSYIIGSRGSGKTTLLKALSWDERLHNPWLREALGGDPFRGRFIAAYTKLPLIQVCSFRRWLDKSDDEDHAALFGFYIDLISVENLASALSEIVGQLAINISAEAEKAYVQEFLEQNEFLSEDNSEIASLRHCHLLVKKHRRELEAFARRQLTVPECLANLVLPEIGELSRSFCRWMSELLEEDESLRREDHRTWHFKFCFDEAESLDERQLLVFNTLTRTTEWPCFYALSFVGQPSDLSLTLHKDLTNTEPDRYIHFLDELDHGQFKTLCDGVASLRINAALSQNDKTIEFTTRELLGDLDLNSIVHDLVQKSEGDFADQLKQQASEFGKSQWTRSQGEQTIPPYIEGYLASELQLEQPNQEKRRSQASREFRKKIVASYLSICRELQVDNVPYAFAEMVFGISDRCVRDYLSQMHRIFDMSGLTVQELNKSRIKWQVQAKAIRLVSEKKKKSISEGIEVTKPERIRRVTECLGELTAMLQHGRKGSVTHLKSSERGIFKFHDPIKEDDDKDAELFTALKDGGDAGFLRVKKEGNRIEGVRVHASMAPAFGFSYRGAYYSVSLRRMDLDRMLGTDQSDDLRALAYEIAERIGGRELEPDQLSLFPAIDGDDGHE